MKGGGIGPSHRQSATLRQQCSGIKIDASKNVSSVLRLEHLKNMANWTSGEASMPPLAALFGHRLLSAADEIGIPLDASFFPCQRCVLLSAGHHNYYLEWYWISCWCFIISLSKLCTHYYWPSFLLLGNLRSDMNIWLSGMAQIGIRRRRVSCLWFIKLLYFFHCSSSQTLSWAANNHNLFL